MPCLPSGLRMRTDVHDQGFMADLQPRVRHLLVLHQQQQQFGRDRGQAEQVLDRQDQRVVVVRPTRRESCKERWSLGQPGRPVVARQRQQPAVHLGERSGSRRARRTECRWRGRSRAVVRLRRPAGRRCAKRSRGLAAPWERINRALRDLPQTAGGGTLAPPAAEWCSTSTLYASAIIAAGSPIASRCRTASCRLRRKPWTGWLGPFATIDFRSFSKIMSDRLVGRLAGVGAGRKIERIELDLSGRRQPHRHNEFRDDFVQHVPADSDRLTVMTPDQGAVDLEQLHHTGLSNGLGQAASVFAGSLPRHTNILRPSGAFIKDLLEMPILHYCTQAILNATEYYPIVPFCATPSTWSVAYGTQNIAFQPQAGSAVKAAAEKAAREDRRSVSSLTEVHAGRPLQGSRCLAPKTASCRRKIANDRETENCCRCSLKAARGHRPRDPIYEQSRCLSHRHRARSKYGKDPGGE